MQNLDPRKLRNPAPSLENALMRCLVCPLVLAASAALGGCAAPALSVKYAYAPETIAMPSGLTVVDRRSPTESESEILSYNVANEQYGITRLGDAQVIPNRVAYLATQLQQKAGQRLTGRSVTIEHFTVHLNKQAAHRKFAAGAAVGGAVGSAIQSSLDPSRPFIDTELELLVEARRVSSRQRVNLGSGPEQEQVAAAIKVSLDAAVDDVIRQLGVLRN